MELVKAVAEARDVPGMTEPFALMAFHPAWRRCDVERDGDAGRGEVVVGLLGERSRQVDPKGVGQDWTFVSVGLSACTARVIGLVLCDSSRLVRRRGRDRGTILLLGLRGAADGGGSAERGLGGTGANSAAGVSRATRQRVVGGVVVGLYVLKDGLDALTAPVTA